LRCLPLTPPHPPIPARRWRRSSRFESPSSRRCSLLWPHWSRRLRQ
jgi:hypothetical protein